MNRHHQRRLGRRGGQRMTGHINRLATFPAGRGKQIENIQSGRTQIESPTGHSIFDELLHTVSEVIGELRRPPQIHSKLPQSDRKPLSYPIVDPALCTGCGLCANVCPTDAISIHVTARIDESLCTRCRKCFEACPRRAITFVEEASGMPS